MMRRLTSNNVSAALSPGGEVETATWSELDRAVASKIWESQIFFAFQRLDGFRD